MFVAFGAFYVPYVGLLFAEVQIQVHPIAPRPVSLLVYCVFQTPSRLVVVVGENYIRPPKELLFDISLMG